MDALIASAGPIKPQKRQYKPLPRKTKNGVSGSHQTVPRGEERIDPSLDSILTKTRLPLKFHTSNLAKGSSEDNIKPDRSLLQNVSDKKLRAKIARTNVSTKRARKERDDVNEWLNAPIAGGQGGIEVDEDMGEKSWRIGQEEIRDEVGIGSGSKRFDLKFEGMGSYNVDYTRNGRHLAIASTSGHVATFDWQAGKLNSEIQLRESVRDIKFLQSESFYAVAQKKYVYIYDQDGVELHKLKQHIDPTHLTYLPYHYLLASVGHAGHLKYHDVSTGVMLTQIPTHLGSPSTLSLNSHSGIIHMGHQNGTVTLWSPNQTTPHVKLLAHRGPITSIAIDPSESSAGRYMATSGLDGMVKIWDNRKWGEEVKSFTMNNNPKCLEYSGKGMLAIGGKSGITVYHNTINKIGKSAPYLTIPIPSLTVHSMKFCPFDDVLAVGHQKGISSLLVPGSGEANFDSNEADVFESHTRRREREVRGVLEKIRPELITFNDDFLSGLREERPQTMEERVSRSYRQLGRMERLKNNGNYIEGENGDEEKVISDDDAPPREGETEEQRFKRKRKEKKKQRGRGGSTARYLKKKKQNVVDSSLLSMRMKVSQQKKAQEAKEKIDRGEIVKETGALARFG